MRKIIDYDRVAVELLKAIRYEFDIQQTGQRRLRAAAQTYEASDSTACDDWMPQRNLDCNDTESMRASAGER
jgi:hypothetical protein